MKKREKFSRAWRQILGMRIAILNRAFWMGLVETGITEQRHEGVRKFAMRILEERSTPGRRTG